MGAIERVSLVGLGAIGGVYASRIHDMDPGAITVIVDPERLQRYQDPTRVNGRPYPFRLVTPDTPTAPADLVLVAVKHHQLDAAVKAIDNHVGPDTVILSLLNGIASEEILAHAYGSEHLLYAMCVGIDALRDGRAVRYSNIGRVCFGERLNAPPYPEKVERVRAFFERAAIPYEIPADMLRALWWKFMINVGVNQTSAVLKAPYGVFQREAAVRTVMVRTMQEVIALSAPAGVPLADTDITAFLEVLAALDPEGKTSMLQDMEAGRKTEVEFLAGTVCELGARYGMPTPMNRALWDIITAMEAMAGVRG